ncbi:MAG: hypothetical protein ACOC0N_03250 [Chroococcales cyanobacterium]
MTADKPLSGTTLVDCAKANAKQGLEVAAKNCGYGNNIRAFQQELKQSCDRMGIEITELSDLITEREVRIHEDGIDVAPETGSRL